MTEQGIEKILKDLPRYWKTIGEKRYVEDAYRYLMLHKELQETPEGKITFDYLKTRVVQLWCKETKDSDEVWVSNFIDKLFSDQIQRTPRLAERGKEHAEFLLRQFKAYQNSAKILLRSKIEEK